MAGRSDAVKWTSELAEIDLGIVKTEGGELASLLAGLVDLGNLRVILFVAPPGALESWPKADQASAIAGLDIPSVIWIDGNCSDAGLALALGCDIRVSAHASTYGPASLSRDLLPPDGLIQRLARLVGRGQALWMLLTGQSLNANQAEQVGLVQHLGNLKDALTIASDIKAGGPIAVAYAREAVLRGSDMPLNEGLRLEADLSVLLQSTADRAEGLSAFRDHRLPDYQGK